MFKVRYDSFTCLEINHYRLESIFFLNANEYYYLDSLKSVNSYVISPIKKIEFYV